MLLTVVVVYHQTERMSVLFFNSSEQSLVSAAVENDLVLIDNWAPKMERKLSKECLILHAAEWKGKG